MLTRFLLRWAEPFSALIAVALAAAMVEAHLLARPHMLAMPLLVLWSGALFAGARHRLGAAFPAAAGDGAVGQSARQLSCSACCSPSISRPRRCWPDPVGGSKRGAGACSPHSRLAAALVTPNGIAGLVQPFRLMAMPALQSSFIEWRSPNFQDFQPLEIMLLGLVALGLTTGVKAPPTRVLILVGLCHMALAHTRHADLLGLVGPLAVAGSLGPQLAARIRSAPAFADQPRRRPARRAGRRPGDGADLAVALAMSLPLLLRPIVRTEDRVTPTSALAAAARMGLTGHVFNSEGFGGYLVFRGVPTFIDGRIELYGNAFLARYLDAVNGNSRVLGDLLARWNISWALLEPQQGAVAVLDHLPGWRRAYRDARAVIFVRSRPAGTAARRRRELGRQPIRRRGRRSRHLRETGRAAFWKRRACRRR